VESISRDCHSSWVILLQYAHLSEGQEPAQALTHRLLVLSFGIHLMLWASSLSILDKLVLQPVEPALHLPEIRRNSYARFALRPHTASDLTGGVLRHLYESRSLLSPSPISLRNLACLLPASCSWPAGPPPAGRFRPDTGVATCAILVPDELGGGVFLVYPLIVVCFRISTNLMQPIQP